MGERVLVRQDQHPPRANLLQNRFVGDAPVRNTNFLLAETIGIEYIRKIILKIHFHSRF